MFPFGQVWSSCLWQQAQCHWINESNSCSAIARSRPGRGEQRSSQNAFCKWPGSSRAGADPMSGEAPGPQKRPTETGCAVRLAVVHWFPLEQYPPARNLVNYFGDDPGFCVLVCTTHPDPGRKAFAHHGVKVVRWKFPGRTLARLYRLFLFAGFPLFVFWQLVFFRPDVLLYFEPHSSFPAFLYLLLTRRCRLFIHYHEFRDQKEYRQPGNRLIALYHWFEKRWLYRRAVWISQTNDDRVRMFLEDYPDVDAGKMRSLPNLPPQKWFSAANLRRPADGPEDVPATLAAVQQPCETAMSPADLPTPLV